MENIVRKMFKYILIVAFVIVGCSREGDNFISLKNDYENIFSVVRDTNFVYKKEDLITIRKELTKILEEIK